jgi:hypothetical protein
MSRDITSLLEFLIRNTSIRRSLTFKYLVEDIILKVIIEERMFYFI